MPPESEQPEEVEGVGLLELEALSSGRAIFHIALPAVLLNGAIGRSTGLDGRRRFPTVAAPSPPRCRLPLRRRSRAAADGRCADRAAGQLCLDQRNGSLRRRQHVCGLPGSNMQLSGGRSVGELGHIGPFWAPTVGLQLCSSLLLHACVPPPACASPLPQSCLSPCSVAFDDWEQRVCCATGCFCRAAKQNKQASLPAVQAKVGAAAGARDWAALATHARLSLRWSAALGVGALPLLLAARWPGLVMLGGEVAAAGGPYWTLRACTTPLQLLNMATAGILQVSWHRARRTRGSLCRTPRPAHTSSTCHAGTGSLRLQPSHVLPTSFCTLQGYSRVRVNAALTSGAAVLEMAASAVVLRRQAEGSSASTSLVALGLVSMSCQLLLTVVSLACMLLLPPPEARGHLRLLRPSGSSSRATQHDDTAPAAPLLGGTSGEDGLNGVAPEAGEPCHQHRGERQALEQAAEEARAAPAELLGKALDKDTLAFLR